MYVNEDTAKKLAVLRADYESVTCHTFAHFYCPVLFRDDPVPLSHAHIINTAFPDSDRRWTIQRADVDNFFGSLFERDFVVLAEKGKHDAVDVLTSKALSRRFHPKLVADGRHVEHYLPKGPVPPNHSEIQLTREGETPVRFVLKLEPNETLSALDRNWEIVIEKDLRLVTLVSLLKAAHLTMFELIGYRYTLSAAGRFVGWDVLGSFVAENMGRERTIVLANAGKHFPEFVNLVRPMLIPPTGLKGTISDGYLYLCTGDPKPWAVMLFVRIAEQMHTVLVPVLEDPEGAARFVRFLKNPPPNFEVRLARFAGEQWEVAKDSRTINWPEAKFS